MGSLIDKSEEDRETRIQSRLNNYNLGVISQHDYTYPTKTATFLYTTKETEHCYAVFSNFLFDYYTDPREFHKCIIHQTRSIICILDISTKYDLETNSHVTKPIDSIFYCRASYSSRWILRSWPSTYLLNYECMFFFKCLSINLLPSFCPVCCIEQSVNARDIVF